MKWQTNTQQIPVDEHRARCGPLYVRIEDNGDACEWFIEPDDKDKSYRRALERGTASTVDAAKSAATAACERIVETMQASLRE